MPIVRRLGPAAFAFACLSSHAFAGTKCSTLGGGPCTFPAATSCFVDCGDPDPEGQLRAAVHTANQCSASSPGARTIGFQNCPASPTSIPLALTTTGGQAICNGSPMYDDTAICLGGSQITVDGALGAGRVRLEFLPPDLTTQNICKPTSPGDEDHKALFVLRGSNNTIKNLEMEYFPEGIHVYTGSGHRIENVDSSHICDEAFTVENGDGSNPAPSGLVITECDLLGDTCGCPQAAVGSNGTCLPAGGSTTCATNRCGQDKAIQVNGGTGTVIRRNRFTTIGQPVLVNRVAPTATTVTFECNTVTGRNPALTTCDRNATPPVLFATPRNVTEGVTVLSGTASIHHNRFQYAKFGVRVQGRGAVDAYRNVVRDGYVSAFNVSCLDQNPTPGSGKCFLCSGGSSDGGSCDPLNPSCPGGGTCAGSQTRLRGEANWMLNYAFDTQGTDCPRAAVVFRSESGASPPGLIDFGGGSCVGRQCGTAGAPVVGATVSGGANYFCDAEGFDGGKATHLSFWNQAESACAVGGCAASNTCDASRPAAMCGSPVAANGDWCGAVLWAGCNVSNPCPSEPDVLAEAPCTS